MGVSSGSASKTWQAAQAVTLAEVGKGFHPAQPALPRLRGTEAEPTEVPHPAQPVLPQMSRVSKASKMAWNTSRVMSRV